ncbi:GNAT family N-acetyltransferase [Erwiniaceae bacterium CAU 1747]
MKIRRFREGDEIPLLHVFFSSVHGIASRDYTPEQIAAWAPDDMDKQKWTRQIGQLQPFVVEIEGKIAGYADVQSDGYIDHFYVSGNFPRQGVGTLLMEGIHQEARRLGLSELTSNVSRTAEPFFLRHGFHIVRQGFPVCRGVTLQNALMRKALAVED